MSRVDNFEDLARYYDNIMDDINYDRWLLLTTLLVDLLPSSTFRHLDVGCGTGTLVKRLMAQGWNTQGIDLSFAMLRAARSSGIAPTVAQADMCALPMKSQHFDFLTCVFDSLNFLLEVDHLNRAIAEMGRVLKPNGLLYFDIVTERMVSEHFADQRWSEDNGRFVTTWEGSYDRKKKVAETAIQVDTGTPSIIREKICSMDDIKVALKAAGLSLVGTYDAENWNAPGKKTVRIDIIVLKGDPRTEKKPLKIIENYLQAALKQQ